MVEHSMDFDFDTHIQKLDKEVVREKLRKSLLRKVHSLRTGESLDEVTERRHDELTQHFDIFRNFFTLMRDIGDCDVQYIHTVEDDWESHDVRIEGSDTKTFDITGLPKFGNDEARKIMHLPVKYNDDEFMLTFFDHPQQHVPPPPFGKVEVMYEFATRFSLGSHSKFQKDPLKTWTVSNTTNYHPIRGNNYVTLFNLLILERASEAPFGGVTGFERYWYGKEGKPVYRFQDALWGELANAIFGPWYHGERYNFKMQGIVHTNPGDSFLYQGKLESSGTFPFFLGRDDGSAKSKSPKPVMPDMAPV